MSGETAYLPKKDFIRRASKLQVKALIDKTKPLVDNASFTGSDSTSQASDDSTETKVEQV